MRTYRMMHKDIIQALGMLGTFWLGLVCSSFAQITVPADDAQFTHLIYQTREIGLRKDRAQMDTLLIRLQNASYEKITAQAIRLRLTPGMPWSANWSTHLYAATFVALERLGDPRAIPAIEAFVQEPTRQHLKPFAVVAVARIKAENIVPHPKTVVEWERKAQVFSQALGLSLKEIGEASMAENVYVYLEPPNLSRLALRSLAEMAVEAYKGGVSEAINRCEAMGVRWENDVAASLTVRLAYLSEDERVRWLIQSIHSRQAFTPADQYFMQALADRGGDALKPITDWLDQVLQERSTEERNTPYTRSDRLLQRGFGLLAAIGIPESQALLRQYRHRVESDEYLCHLIDTNLKHSPRSFTSDW